MKKALILIAVLLLPLLLVSLAPTLQAPAERPDVGSPSADLVFNVSPGESPGESCSPGSGGGGEGVI